MHTIEKKIEVYEKWKHLKLAADELGMAWQTLYYHLKQHGHEVTGDKKKYGGNSDQVAVMAESKFKQLVPHAVDMNKKKFQAKYDFTVGEVKVDVKASYLKSNGKPNSQGISPLRWALTTKAQDGGEDFIVGFCMKSEDNTDLNCDYRILLIPREYVGTKQSISISQNGSKWDSFEITEKELAEFFENFKEDKCHK